MLWYQENEKCRGGFGDDPRTDAACAARKTYAKKLERSNKELQDFASVASHDLQEPLRKIQAFSDRLRSRCAAALDEQIRADPVAFLW